MPIQICKITDDGTIQRPGVEGFYKGSGETTTYTIGPPYWQQLVEYESEGQPDGSLETWLAWAANVDTVTNSCGLSFVTQPFEGPPGSTIHYIKVVFTGYGGQLSGAYATPSGTGNNFNLGLYYNGTFILQAQTFLGRTAAEGQEYFYSTFNTKSDGTPWTTNDFPVQPCFLYGYYVLQSEKGTINDNAQNVAFSIHVEISYTPPDHGPASAFFLFI